MEAASVLGQFADLVGRIEALPAEVAADLVAALQKKFGRPMPIEFMVGHLRYQPEKLKPIFGYDHLYRAAIEYELAGMDTLAELGVIAAGDYALLTPEIREKVLAIATTLVDELERTGRGHDILALVALIRKELPEVLRRWVHIMFTSYDPLATSLSIELLRAYGQVIRPQTIEVLKHFSGKVREHADTKALMHTHLQPALPATAGFWLATILERVVYCAQKLEISANELFGKVAGAVGAKNAQVLFGIPKLCGDRPFDERVLAKLGLKPAPISTQILPPEPVDNFLHNCMQLAQAFGQLGNDGRILMMREIGEVEETATGASAASSAMSSKIANPRWFESLAGMAKLAKWSYTLVLDCMQSNLQRDLVDSAPYRFFPMTVIFLAVQLETLLKPNKKTKIPFLQGIVINREICLANLKLRGQNAMGEPVHTALFWFGYTGDAHELVNTIAAPAARKSGRPIIDEVKALAEKDSSLRETLARIPERIMATLSEPENYIGDACEQALRIADMADKYVTAA